MEGITKIHVRFKGSKTETLTALNPKSSAQLVKALPTIVESVDELLDNRINSEIADILKSARISSRRIGPTQSQLRSFHRAARCLSPPSIRAPLLL
jgi:hypothetical protein